MKTIEELWIEFCDLGLMKGHCHNIPKYCAAKQANEYKLTFDYTWFNITAYLHRKNWEKKIDLTVSPFDYGQPQMLSIKERKRLKYIFGGGNTFEMAIFRCLINARIAGVI
jgi:hypothetical protein